jgi:hypothetical protein
MSSLPSAAELTRLRFVDERVRRKETLARRERERARVDKRYRAPPPFRALLPADIGITSVRSAADVALNTFVTSADNAAVGVV